jgi:hypothetical protein
MLMRAARRQIVEDGTDCLVRSPGSDSERDGEVETVDHDVVERSDVSASGWRPPVYGRPESAEMNVTVPGGNR